MNKRRMEKMAEEIRREVSQILAEEIKDPRLSLVSVTRVEVSNDLGSARIYVSVLGDEAKQADAQQALERARGFIRTEISSRIRLRHAPDISFRVDHSIEHGIRIADMLNKISSEENRGNDSDPTGD